MLWKHQTKILYTNLFHLTNIQKGKIKNKQRRWENFKTLKPVAYTVLFYGARESLGEIEKAVETQLKTQEQ